MKKFLAVLGFLVASPAAFSVTASPVFNDYFKTAETTFSGSSQPLTFSFSWADLVQQKNDITFERNGSYVYALTTMDGSVVGGYASTNFLKSDAKESTSGSKSLTFSGLSEGVSYKLFFSGSWNGKDGSKWLTTSAPSVSISMVPEPESYAMFLAGLGIIGAVVRRRNRA